MEGAGCDSGEVSNNEQNGHQDVAEEEHHTQPLRELNMLLIIIL